MLLSKVQVPSVKNGIFHSLRFHLLFCLVLGVIVPAQMVILYTGDALSHAGPASNSMVAAAVSAFLAVFILRRLAFYPTTSRVKFILPATSILFGLGVVTFFVLRLKYSSLIFATSYVATTASLYALATLQLRGPAITYYIVPGGRSPLVEELDHLFGIRMEKPELPELKGSAFIADLHHDLDPQWQRLLAEAAISGCPVYHYKQIWEAATGKLQIEHLSENSFGALLPTLGYRKAKRAIDLGLSIALLPLIAPVCLLVALAIRFDSPGPVLFRQQRMGYRGKTFSVCKFRTMKDCSESNSATSSVTQHNDSRITRVGRLLRRTRIDELPQVINIIRGEMSWIGPRPEALDLSNLYEQEIPFYRYRHIVRPGITGWAQVNQGHVTSLSEIDHKLQFDFYYIKNFSYWIDLLIFFRTLRVVMSGFGAK